MPTQTEQFTIPLFGFKTPLINFKKVLFPLPFFPIIIHKPEVLILDEPTSALGVHQASVVLKYIVKAAASGLGVILITHNVHHAYPVGNSFTILNRGKSMGTFDKKNLSREKLLGMMAGGEELDKLEVELKEIDRIVKN